MAHGIVNGHELRNMLSVGDPLYILGIKTIHTDPSLLEIPWNSHDLWESPEGQGGRREQGAEVGEDELSVRFSLSL